MSRQQQSVLLFPLVLIGLGWLMLTIRQQIMLRLHNASLVDQTRSLEQANFELKTKASTDSLTELLVRRAFLERCNVEIDRSRRQGRPLTLVVVDLDHFKRVNDNYGHATGDLVLKTFASILRRDLRSIDVAGRWGGEEFVVLMPDTSLADALAVIERIRVIVSQQSFPSPADRLEVTMSAGLAEFDGTTQDPEHIVAQADKALYEAKRLGRNRTCCFSTGMREA
jgi:diguanylate cyclase (GGDEF)-like protein